LGTILLNIVAAIRGIIVFLGMVIYMLVYAISCIIYKHTKQRALNLRTHYLKYVAIPVLNIKITKVGEPSDKTALYVANHRSFADPIVICKYLQAFVIAKAEVAHYPIINKGAELTGVIWVDRNNKDSRTATRDKLTETIDQGFNILVFPEGTVGVHNHTLPFRKGTFMEAAENNIPVVPIAIEFRSEKDLWVREKFLPQYFHQFSKWKTEVKVKFGKPISNTNGEILHQQAYDWINQELSDMQKDWSYIFN
jgi:1-acyl-sn-glycerol-3-phosphate acyltransferase